MTAIEKKHVVWLAVFLILVTSLPYVIGYQLQTEDWRYSGLSIGVDDGNSYLAKMLRGAEGDWLFRTPYTAYSQRGGFFFFPYLLLGKLTAPPGQHEQLVALFHLFRVAGVAFLTWTVSVFLARFIQKERYRLMATALALAGGGLGWAKVLLPSVGISELPLDFYSPETFGFLGIFSIPHLPWARGLLLLGLLWYLDASAKRYPEFSSKWVIKSLPWIGIGFFQPLTIATGWAVVGAHTALTAIQEWLLTRDVHVVWTRLRHRLVAVFWLVAISCPFVLYSFITVQSDPILKAWATQNIIRSPGVGYYLLAYALVIPPAGWAIWKSWKTKDRTVSLLTAWVLAFPILAYFPMDIQRRLPEGVWVAWVGLSFITIEQWVSSRKGWKWPARCWYACGFLTTLMVLAGSLFTLQNKATPLFIPTDQRTIFEAIREQASGSPVILASFGTSNPLPAYLPAFTLVGHGPESVNLAQIEPRVQCYYARRCPEVDRQRLLDEFHVEWVLWGPAEKALGDYQLLDDPNLDLITQAGEYALFKVHSTNP